MTKVGFPKIFSRIPRVINVHFSLVHTGQLRKFKGFFSKSIQTISVNFSRKVFEDPCLTTILFFH